MWNMGILFLIYYCVTVFSTKSDGKSVEPFDMANLETEDEGGEEQEINKSVEFSTKETLMEVSV